MSTRILITYDIANDKLRNKFSKYLLKFGYRLQYSVFDIQNSERVLANIQAKIQSTFAEKFGQSDSVIIFEFSASCKQTHYGRAKNMDSDLLIM
jgi:CRISPR-associated protein Cas2